MLSKTLTSSKGKSNAYLFDFLPLDEEVVDEETGVDLWEFYQKLCYSQEPPVPSLSLLRKICDGTEYALSLRHFKIGNHLSIVLKVLQRIKTTSELDLCDNSLDYSCVAPLLDFIHNSDSLSNLNISFNPGLGTKSIITILQEFGVNRSLETLDISNTGCFGIGKAVSQLISSCYLLQDLNISGCGLKQTAIDLAQSIPNGQKLSKLNLSQNQLHIPGKRFATLLGQNISKSQTLQVINLSHNMITSEMAQVFFRTIADSMIKTIDLSDNSIGDDAGRAIALYISKSQRIRHLNISENPILNVSINQVHLKALSEESSKQANAKKTAPKAPLPGVYIILNSAAKSQSLRDITMLGIVVDRKEWNDKLAVLSNLNNRVSIIYTSQESASYVFHE